MIASDVTFENMMNQAITSFELAEATSFLQVEYGLDDLKACWDGFVHTSDHYGQRYKSRKEVCAEFANALADYIEFITKPASQSLG